MIFNTSVTISVGYGCRKSPLQQTVKRKRSWNKAKVKQVEELKRNRGRAERRAVERERGDTLLLFEHVSMRLRRKFRKETLIKIVCRLVLLGT